MYNRNLRVLQFPVSQILTVYRRSVLVTHIHNVYVLNFTFLINEEPILLFGLLKMLKFREMRAFRFKEQVQVQGPFHQVKDVNIQTRSISPKSCCQKPLVVIQHMKMDNHRLDEFLIQEKMTLAKGQLISKDFLVSSNNLKKPYSFIRFLDESLA